MTPKRTRGLILPSLEMPKVRGGDFMEVWTWRPATPLGGAREGD
jgi:hypothetical protein